VGESAGAYIQGGIYGNHWGNVVDDGPGGTGGMQAGRGHRALTIHSGYREFGMGSQLREDGRRDNVQLFGEGSGARLIGGVAFADWNSNGMYDVGEGLGSLHIEARLPRSSSPGATTFAWASGAYVLEPGSNGPLELCGSYFGLELAFPVPEGSENAKFDFELREILLAHGSQLREQLAGKPSKKAVRAARDLAFWTHALPQLESPLPLPKEVIALRDEWAQTSQALQALLNRGQAGPANLAELARQFQGSQIGIWYGEALQISQWIEARTALLISKGSASTRQRKQAALFQSAVEALPSLRHVDLRNAAQTEIERIRALDFRRPSK
jgi:hypothetical protein